MLRAFRIARPVARNSNVEPEDARTTQSALAALGLLDLPDGPTAFPTSQMIDGVKRFQKAEGLNVDGVMKPGGETEAAVDRALKLKAEARARNDARNRRRDSDRARSQGGPERRDTPDSLIGFPPRSSETQKARDDAATPQRPATPNDPLRFPSAARRKPQGSATRNPQSPKQETAARAPGLLSSAASDDALRGKESPAHVPTRRVEPPAFSDAELDAVEVTRKRGESHEGWRQRIEGSFDRADLIGKRKILAAMARQWALPKGVGEYRETASGKRVFNAPQTQEDRRKFAFAQAVKPDAHKSAERAPEEIQRDARAGKIDGKEINQKYFVGPGGVVYERRPQDWDGTATQAKGIAAYLRAKHRESRFDEPNTRPNDVIPERFETERHTDRVRKSITLGRPSK